MKNIFFLICALPMMSLAQIGSIKTEQYKADFEKKQSIEVVANYTDTIQIPIQTPIQNQGTPIQKQLNTKFYKMPTQKLCTASKLLQNATNNN